MNYSKLIKISLISKNYISYIVKTKNVIKEVLFECVHFSYCMKWADSEWGTFNQLYLCTRFIINNIQQSKIWMALSV